MTEQELRTIFVCSCIGLGVSLITLFVNMGAVVDINTIDKTIAANEPKNAASSIRFCLVLNLVCMMACIGGFLSLMCFSHENLDKIENANRRAKEQELRAKESARRDADIALLNTLTAFRNQDADAVSTTIADARAAIDKLHSKSS